MPHIDITPCTHHSTAKCFNQPAALITCWKVSSKKCIRCKKRPVFSSINYVFHSITLRISSIQAGSKAIQSNPIQFSQLLCFQTLTQIIISKHISPNSLYHLKFFNHLSWITTTNSSFSWSRSSIHTPAKLTNLLQKPQSIISLNPLQHIQKRYQPKKIPFSSVIAKYWYIVAIYGKENKSLSMRKNSKNHFKLKPQTIWSLNNQFR